MHVVAKFFNFIEDDKQKLHQQKCINSTYPISISLAMKRAVHRHATTQHLQRFLLDGDVVMMLTMMTMLVVQTQWAVVGQRGGLTLAVAQHQRSTSIHQALWLSTMAQHSTTAEYYHSSSTCQHQDPATNRFLRPTHRGAALLWGKILGLYFPNSPLLLSHFPRRIHGFVRFLQHRIDKWQDVF